MPEYIPIKSVEHLRQMAIGKDDGISVKIILNYGSYSSKEIRYFDDIDTWEIYHNISDTWVEYKSTKEFVEEEDFLVDAIWKKALYAYPELVEKSTVITNNNVDPDKVKRIQEAIKWESC